MVTKYGMSDKVGNVSIDYDDDGRSLSSETRSAVEEEVRQPCSFSSFMQCVCKSNLLLMRLQSQCTFQAYAAAK